MPVMLDTPVKMPTYAILCRKKANYANFMLSKLRRANHAEGIASTMDLSLHSLSPLECCQAAWQDTRTQEIRVLKKMNELRYDEVCLATHLAYCATTMRTPALTLRWRRRPATGQDSSTCTILLKRRCFG